MLIRASNAIRTKYSVRAFKIATAIGVSLSIYSTAGIGAITAEEAARLGGEVLTPMGSIRAGNEAGTIPEWTGGISVPPAGFDAAKDNYINPYADEEPLFTITRDNYQQYKDKMTVGQQALFERYPDYFMPVYPSHRSAAWPDWVYEQTKNRRRMSAFVGIPQPRKIASRITSRAVGWHFHCQKMASKRCGASIQHIGTASIPTGHLLGLQSSQAAVTLPIIREMSATYSRGGWKRAKSRWVTTGEKWRSTLGLCL